MLRSINDHHGREVSLFTLNTVDWVDIFIRPVYKQVVVHTLNHFIESKGLQVHAWCLMSNHLNLIAQANAGFILHEIEKEYRSFTTIKILEAIDTELGVRRNWMLERFQTTANNGRHNSNVWQENSFVKPVDLGNMAGTLESFHFVHDRPVKDRCVDLAADYSYSSARDYAGIKGLVNVSKIPDVEQQLAAAEGISDAFFVKYIRS